MEEKKTRGGARKGAGRHRREQPRAALSFKVEPETAEAFRAICQKTGKSQSEAFVYLLEGMLWLTGEPLKIAIDSHHDACGDGCCDLYYDVLEVDGTQIPEKFSRLCAESIEAILNHLKIKHEFINSPPE